MVNTNELLLKMCIIAMIKILQPVNELNPYLGKDKRRPMINQRASTAAIELKNKC